MSTKTEVKHTPGPWNVGGHWQDDEDTIYSGTMALARALKSREHVGTPIEQFDANARLIAAAPDLLQELEKLYYQWQILACQCVSEREVNSGHKGCIVEKGYPTVVAAIRKARGE